MTTESVPAGWVTAFAGARRQIAVALGVAALVFVVLTIWWGTWGWQGRKAVEKPAEPDPTAAAEPEAKPEAPPKARSVDYLPAAVWAGLLAVLAGGAAYWMTANPLPTGAEARASQVRAEVLTIGAIAGFLTAVMGILLGIRWHESLFKWVSGGSTQEAKWVLIAASIFTAGLIIMFLSLQIGRTEERSNAVLRRMLYGFNAVFLGVLLLLVLLVVNVVSFLKVPSTLLTTDRAFSELSEPSKNFLRSLDEPVHVYMIIPEKYVEGGGRSRTQYTRLYNDTRLFLENCEEYSPHFHFTELSPSLDTIRILALKDRLKVSVGEQELIGLIATVGKNEDTVTFIPATELWDSVPIGPRSEMAIFQGESRLLTELGALIASRANEVVYFTQDNSELGIGGMGGPTGLRSASAIVAYLHNKKVKVEPLKLDAAGKVPADAAVVVVAGPQTPFAADGPMLKALRAYMKPTDPNQKPGRLLAYLPAVKGLKGEVQETGLEPLLQEFGIEVSRDRRVVTAPGSFSLGRDRQGRVQYLRSEFAVGVVPEGLKVPIQPTLSRVAQHVMHNPRVLRTAPGGPGGNRTHVLLQTPGRGLFTWEEGDWNTPAELTQEIFAQKGEAADRLAAEKHRTGAPVPLAIAATDPTPGDSKRAERARVIVYASDTDLMDRNLDLVPIEYRALLVSDNIDWLRDREANLGIPSKKTHTYEIGKGPDETGLLILLVIMVVVIGGIGLGVWLARRR